MAHFEAGEYREALNAFEQARLFSTTPDPRIDEMIERARGALNPSPTPSPTATPTITPTPRPPVRMSADQPDEALAEAYFGTTYLTVVPGRKGVPPPMSVFWSEYQVGLYVQRLGQTLRQPFTLRVFDRATGRLVGEASAEIPAAAATARPPAEQTTPTAGTPLETPAPTPTPGSPSGGFVTWHDQFVWYRQGGEPPGQYRLELYAGPMLARILDYEVQASFVPVPTATPTATPTLLAAPAETPAAAAGLPVAGAGATTSTPTTTPSPAVAAVAVTGGVPAGLAFNPAIGKLYVADASGVVWTVDEHGPVLQHPFVLEGSPMDQVVDPVSGRLYVALQGSATKTTVAVLHGTSGERLGSITVEGGQVTDLAINPGAHLLYALVPGSEQLSIIDLQQGSITRSLRFDPLARVTGMAVEPNGQRLFLSDLAGQLFIFDAREPRNVQPLGVSATGLAGVAALDNLVVLFNTPARKVYVVNPSEQRIEREISLDQEPGAIAASPASGAAFVLGTQRPAVLRLDLASGQVTGAVSLPDRGGRMSLQPARELAGLRNHITINQFNGTLFIAQPEIGTVSLVTADMFPLAQETAP